VSSLNRRLIYNTRERILSTDLNDTQALVDANLDNGLVMSSVGPGSAAAGFGVAVGSFTASGVVDGLQCQANNPGVSLEVEVLPGLAYKVGTAPTSLDTTLRRIELPSSYVLDLTALVDVLDRWVAIEIAPADALELAALRDIWQPALGTFIPAAVDKIRAPFAVVTANAGVPNANPSLPDGTPGTIPLAYVFLPAGAVSISSTSFVHCRPLYGNFDRASVQGGGVDVDVAGSGTEFEPLGQRGQYSTGAQYAVTPGFTLDASVADIWNTAENFAGLAGNNEAVYAYVCAAPYPTGYDADVRRITREFVNATSAIPSCPNPTQPLILLSTGAPGSSQFGGRALTSQDVTWGTGGSVTASESHYLGTVSYVDSVVVFLPQVTQGGEVRILQASGDPIVQAVATAGAGLTVSADFEPSDVAPLASVPPPGNGRCAPLRATMHLVQVFSGGASTFMNIRLYDENSLVVPLQSAGASSGMGQERFLVWAYTTGNLRIEVQEISGLAAGDVGSSWHGYLDPNLVQR
jgi:hypothetical protein